MRDLFVLHVSQMLCKLTYDDSIPKPVYLSAADALTELLSKYLGGYRPIELHLADEDLLYAVCSKLNLMDSFNILKEFLNIHNKK